MAREVREPEVEAVTIVGRIAPIDSESYMKLVYLAHRFRSCLQKAVKMYAKGSDKNVIVKAITKELNLGYADTIYKIAKLIVEGAKANSSNPLKVEIKKLFIASRGFSANKGNRNIRLVSTDKLQVNVPGHGWVELGVRFGSKYIPLVEELIELANAKKESYTAKIVFRDGKPYLHLSIPLNLYLKYFRRGIARGNLIASFDLNSDRINMVIVDKNGVIRDVKTERFSEVASHGFPRDKANTLRLQALAKLLNYAYHHGVSIVLLEDLEKIRKRKFTGKPNANRKISKFSKRKLVQHGVIMAIKNGFKVYLVNPAYTSKAAEKMCKEIGLDKHTASAYMLALRFLGVEPKILLSI